MPCTATPTTCGGACWGSLPSNANPPTGHPDASSAERHPMPEAPIFVTTHDLLDWLTPHLESWPRPQRFLLAKQVMDSATQFYRLLLRARNGRDQ